MQANWYDCFSHGGHGNGIDSTDLFIVQENGASVPQFPLLNGLMARCIFEHKVTMKQHYESNFLP